MCAQSCYPGPGSAPHRSPPYTGIDVRASSDRLHCAVSLAPCSAGCDTGLPPAAHLPRSSSLLCLVPQAKRDRFAAEIADADNSQAASSAPTMGGVDASAAVAPLPTDGMEPSLIAPVQDANKRLKREVDALGAIRQAELERMQAIAASIADEEAARRPRLDAEIMSCAERLRALRQDLATVSDRHHRRVQVGQLHTALIPLHDELTAANTSSRLAKRKLEDLCDGDIENADIDDPEISAAMRREQAHRENTERLKRQREGLVTKISDLSRVVAPGAQADVPAEDDTEAAGAAPAAEHDFPDLPVLALRVFKKLKAASKSMSGREKARRDIESLLRRDGLLVEGRSMQDYTEEDIPDVMFDATNHKANVKGRRLSGAQSRPLKILKEIPQREYKQLKRAIVTAHRLRHPGVVPVECAFVSGDLVVIQSRFYTGGNMRQWCPEQSQEARLAAARRVAEAVQFLHSKGIIHRDIKPENIVFDGADGAALPALCDFDISVDTLETMAATAVRGTPVYMAPEAELSMATDVYALGVTIYDLLHCDGDLSKLPTSGMGIGARFDADAAVSTLNGCGDRCARLLPAMLAAEPSDRPTAEQVVAELVDAVDEATHRKCCVAAFCEVRMPLRSGLECTAAEPHFSCDDCLSGDMMSRQIPGLTAESPGLICCGCTEPMDQKTVLEHVSREAYTQYFGKIKELQEAQMQLQLDKRVKEETAKLLQKSALELAVMTARNHINDEVMTIKCPNPQCRRAFDNFNGCAALTCFVESTGTGCKQNFCAFCLAATPGDAHAHVTQCPKNPARGGYHADLRVWEKIMDERKRDKLREYWATLKEDTRNLLVWDPSIEDAFRSVGAPVPPRPYQAQVAQLRGMGFVDVDAIRAALEHTQGDVAEALAQLQ